MIRNYRTIELFGKPLFTWVDIETPTKIVAPMPDNEACFSYILEGENHSYSEKEEVNIQTNQAVLNKCGNYVTKMLSTQDKEIFSSVTVHFSKDTLEKIYETSAPFFLKNQEGTSPYNAVKVAASPLVKQYVDGLIHYFNHRELITEDILILKLKEIILLLLQTESSPQIREIMQNLFSSDSLSFKEVIEAHICSSISQTELAELCNLSLSTFKRKFKEIYGDAPSRYLIRRRAEKVANLLLVSDESISAIAYDCGFNSVSHLSKVFKGYYGMSPSQYRLNASNK